ncbi:MAG: deoxyhypusine synthase family protein [Candidatus Aenigmatarchaeota archaeon]
MDHNYLGALEKFRAQIPLRITSEFINAATYQIDHVDAHLGYQAQEKFHAAKRWTEAVKNKEFTWLGLAGAATPVGLGGLLADAMSRGLIDAIVTTGANAFHDLHFAFGLPVRHGSPHCDDEKISKDEITRIYSQFIHNKYTLKLQDMIVQEYGRKIFSRLKPPFSTATFLYELGKEMLNDKSGSVIDKKGSFIVRAAEYDVPVFLNSGSNHSLAMDFLPLFIEGYHVDTSPTQDILEASAITIWTQPQVNIFMGEGDPRNFIQTAAPTASEISYIPFHGSEACIRFTTADERTGGLSGSGKSEARTWGKYKDTRNEIVVWGEYTLTAPTVIAYVAGHAKKEPSRLMKKREKILDDFLKIVRQYEPKRKKEQEKLKSIQKIIAENEKQARQQAGYKF